MKLTEQERQKSLTLAGLDELADERERNKRTRGELTRLSAYMNRGGALVRDEAPGVGLIYRANHICTEPPFGAATVERWCARKKKPLPEAAEH